MIDRRDAMVSKRKQYMVTEYSRFWINQVKIYGFTDYDRCLIHLICSNVPGFGLRDAKTKMLSCAMGTGFPYELSFLGLGFDITCFDISELLTRECADNFLEAGFPGKANIIVGDSDYIPFHDESFDVVYCYRATSYFPDLPQAIFEMFRVLKGGGCLFFDVENLLYPRHLKEHYLLISP